MRTNSILICLAIVMLWLSPLFKGIYSLQAQTKKGKTKQVKKLIKENAPSLFSLNKGINISNYLSNSPEKSPEDRLKWFNESDVSRLKSIGFDHIRIPLDEAILFDSEGKAIKPTFNLLRRTIGWCEKANLKVVVELSSLRNYSFSKDNFHSIWDSELGQQVFINRWLGISKELKYFPSYLIAYELMNEPIAPSDSAWSKLLNKTIKAIRMVEKERFIFISANKYTPQDSLLNIQLPKQDKRLVLSFQFFYPMPLTHYLLNSYGAIGSYAGNISYPGQLIDEKDLSTSEFFRPIREVVSSHNKLYSIDTLERLMLPYIAFANEKGIKLYCGEFGCSPLAPANDRKRWYSDLLTLFTKHKISYAIKEYKGTFGIIDDKNKLDDDLVNMLFTK